MMKPDDASKERNGEETKAETATTRSRSASVEKAAEKAAKSGTFFDKLPLFFKSDFRQTIGLAVSNKKASPRALSKSLDRQVEHVFATEVEPEIAPLSKHKRSVLAEASHFMSQMGKNIRTGNLMKFIPTLSINPLTNKDPMLIPMEAAFQTFLQKLHLQAHWELKDHLNTFVEAISEMKLVQEQPDDEEEGENDEDGSPRAPVRAPVSEEEEEAMRALQQSNCDKVQKFIAMTVDLFGQHPSWARKLEPPVVLWECIEKYIVVQCYHSLYIPRKAEDWKLQSKALELAPIIEPHHVGFTLPIITDIVEKCQSALNQMNFFKSPRNKLICIANCCVHIFNYIENGSGANADDFLGLLSYVMIKASPPSLISNLNYVMDVRDPSMMIASWGYFASNLSIVIAFIEHLDAQSLSSSSPKKSLEQEWTMLQDSFLEQSNELFPPDEESVSGEAPKNLARTTIDIDDFATRYSLFDKSADALSKDDIRFLLAEYKRLALFEYEKLKEKPGETVVTSYGIEQKEVDHGESQETST